MRPNINNYKRTDYSQTTKRRYFNVAHSLDGIGVAKKVPHPKKPAKYRPPEVNPSKLTNNTDAKVDDLKENNVIKMQFSLPSFRQPPGANDAPSKTSLKWGMFMVFGLAFFIFGYHNLWHMLHKTSSVLLLHWPL